MTECKPNPSLSGVLVYIAGGRRPPRAEIMTECKPNPSLSGVLVYIAGGRRPPRAEIMTECKPNPSLSGFWFTLPAAAGRHKNRLNSS